MYQLGWFSSGRDKAARDLLTSVRDSIKLGEIKGEIAFVFCNREPGEAKESDLFIKLVEDYRDTVCKLEAEVRDLKAKLSRAQNPDNPQYTEEEMDAMSHEVADAVLLYKLQGAYTVCKDCGKKYGEYSVGCSSVWEGKCDVCGETKPVTEARDYGYLNKGIKELLNK